MRKWNLGDAREAIARLDLIGPNLEIARYWLSLWRGGRPPLRASFDPKKVAVHLPAIALFSAVPGQSVHCRLAGTYLRLGSGYELTGRDLMELTPPHQRLQRMKNITDIVMGSVWAGNREVRRGMGDETDLIQEICLPFADPAEDGSRRYLMHTNWRPQMFENVATSVPRAHCGIPAAVRMVAMTA